MKGAVVNCYVAASDHTDALRLAIKKLAEQGYIFDDVLGGQVHQLNSSEWDEHITSTFPELSGHFPAQSDMDGVLNSGGVIFGPFCGWE
jgi:hypothetical protein